MKIIGLTGGSGTGKSLISSLFCAHDDVVSVDADNVYRTRCETNQTMLSLLQDAFGDVLNSDNSLNRKKLAEIVFSDEKKLEKLNEITLPFIKEACFAVFAQNKEKKLILFDAPTLFQTGLDSICHKTIGVLTETEIRKKRIMQRDGISEQMALLRIQAQPTDEFFEKNCDYIVRNNGDIPSLHIQIEKLYTILTKE